MFVFFTYKKSKSKTYKWYNVFYVRKSVKSIILRGKSQLHLKSPSLKKIGKYKHGVYGNVRKGCTPPPKNN